MRVKAECSGLVVLPPLSCVPPAGAVTRRHGGGNNKGEGNNKGRAARDGPPPPFVAGSLGSTLSLRWRSCAGGGPLTWARAQPRGSNTGERSAKQEARKTNKKKGGCGRANPAG